MQFSEAELTTAIAGVAKAAFAAQSKDIRKGRVDLEQAWTDLGGYGRYQLLAPLGEQLMPILMALPEVPRVVGERPSFTHGQLKAAVEANTDDEGGRIRHAAVVLAQVALLQAALECIPPYSDPDTFVVPDSL